MTEKVLVSNKSALRKKYGTKGLAEISKAVEDLVAADAARGVSTRLVYLDLVADTKPLQAPKVTEAGDPRQAKEAIDAVFAAISPDYLVILGAPDVIPHQPLVNPVQDDDLDVPSDLPYACEAPFGDDPAQFTSPSRVVSRLPGILGSGEAGYLVRLLQTAAAWKSLARRSYQSHFAVSANVWKGSTRQTVKKLFGTTSRLDISPPDGPGWTRARLQRRTHFFNLHGALEEDRFFGERAGQFPDAHLAERLVGQVREGTLAVAECCYGAELFDPENFGLHVGIANTYLGEGGYGFFGSTNIAYGPADGNGSADLICQFFLREVLNGASIGRATLMARQTYVSQEAPLDPIDLKTLAQFHLLGDGSIHPVKLPAKARPKQQSKSFTSRRRERRVKMFRKARMLAATTPSVGCRPQRGVAAKLRKMLEKLARHQEIDFGDKVQRFAIKPPQQKPASLSKSMASKSAKAKASRGGTYYMMYGRKPAEAKGKDAKSPRRGAESVHGRRAVMLVLERDGELADVRTLLPR